MCRQIPVRLRDMDALDECDETQRKDIIDFIVALTGNRIKVLTTSRPHFPYLRNKFSDTPVQEIRTDDQDLRLYIDQTLSEHTLPDNFKNQIGEVIVSKAGSLYLHLCMPSLLKIGLCSGKCNYFLF
jgi:hypothetical protein